MFLNDVRIEQDNAMWRAKLSLVSEDTAETRDDADDYQTLLNTVDAARAGLASDEHDYDCTEEDVI